MTSGTSTLHAAAVLAAARRARSSENTAAGEVLTQAVEWARLHEVHDLADAATWFAGRGQDTGIPLAGEGAPLVSEFAVAELATALGLSAGSGRNLVAQALELAHRLPRLWARVQAGDLAPWRARRIAEETLCLSADAATWVDQMLAPFAHRTGPAQTQRLVEQAIAVFMPDHAAERRDRAAEARHFDIDHDQVSFAGTARVHGELDLADALDLEDTIASGAAQLAALGNTESLDVRRSQAVGILARGQHALDLTSPVPEPAEGSTGATTGAVSTGPTTGKAGRFAKREVVLYVHLSAEAVRSHDREAVVHLENAGGQLLTAGQVAGWCGGSTGSTTGSVNITVKPVIDLNRSAGVDGYKVPGWLAERVQLRDRTCVHPYCNRPAKRCDVDHIVAYDPDGPPGQTSLDNLACLCRLHHRMKTHAGWSYYLLLPGVFVWHSPHGHTWLRDSSGTTDLTPPTVNPPER
jgi:hypothetical protein